MQRLIGICALLLAVNISVARGDYDNIRKRITEPLGKFEAEEPINCKSVNLAEARQAALTLAHAAMTMPRPDITAIRIAASALNDIGDAALKRKCLEQADETYRSVISVFSSFAFSGERQRAQIGIDDIRAVRK